MAIIGLHCLIYSGKDEATRAFLRDVLGFPSVDAGRGWLIFAAPPAELAVHPTDEKPHHELYLMCDNLDGTIADLKAKGVAVGEIHEQPWGRATHIVMPGGEPLGLYEPRHPTALALRA